MKTSPWDDSTVDNLNRLQESGMFHPYTCGNNSNHILVATTGGWKCPVEGCGYTQDWAHVVPDMDKMTDEPDRILGKTP